MAPKVAPPTQALRVSILESTFPVWSDVVANEKDTSDVYDDPAGLELPTSSRPFLDTWKRSQDLVLNNSNVPITNIAAAPAAPGGKGAAPAGPVREPIGELFAGHNSFEWLLAVFRAVIMVQKSLKPGDFLWELIYPRDPKLGIPVRALGGRYRVRLFIMDTWRCVAVDDRMPVDLFGRSLLVGVRPLALWPLLLCKAVLKVMAAFRMLDDCLPHQVTAFQMLTGWPQEDLRDPHSGTPAAGGLLADRLEDTVKGFQQMTVPRHVATCCLIKLTLPERNPPRIIVISGPSAVGKSEFFTRLLAEYGQRLGITVSHTTRRPREHEEDGRHYRFVKKAQMLTDIQANEFLEHAVVPSTAGSHYYGTSLATVRQVAATGKLCLMCVDTKGAASLHANKRVDGLYIYLVPPSREEHERRIRSRLREAESTIAKRLQWANMQITSARNTQGLFNHVVDNTEWDMVYMDLKEAISTLSPIIRNRLRGLPAYVLDYSDLIPPNSVEKPFLKPVVLGGPNTGERSALLEELAREFPDVFAFPRFHTTRAADEDSRHMAMPGDVGGLSAEASHEVDAQAQPATTSEPPLRPEPVRITPAEFDAAVSSGRFMAHYTDLFTHPLVSYRHGVTLEDVREVIQGGRLPLLELESEGVAAMRQRGVDCLTIFLAPPSVQEYEVRLRSWLSETDESLAARMQQADTEMAEAHGSKVFDEFVVNDDPADTYVQLQRIISKYRPDIIQPGLLDANKQAADASNMDQPESPAALLLYGPPGAGKEVLRQRLLEGDSTTFKTPGRITDRKPAKGEKDTDALQFVKGEVLAKAQSEGRAVEWRQEGSGKDMVTSAVTVEAVEAVVAAGGMAVLETSSPEVLAAAKGAKLKGLVVVFVGCAASLRASLAATGSEEQLPSRLVELQQASDAARALVADSTLNAVVDQPDEDGAYFALRDALEAVVPGMAAAGGPMPLVVAGPFGSGKKALLQRLLDGLPGVFGVAEVTTTRPAAEGMQVISKAEADALVAAGSFLTHQEVLGQLYGITKVAVRKVQDQGRICVLDLDKVEDVSRLRGSGFDANYVYLGPASEEGLRDRITEELVGNPPLGYEPEEAAALFCDAAVKEVLASREPGAFDHWVVNEPSNELASVARLSEVLQPLYPDRIQQNFVWGYGQQLWDPSCRVHGQRPLKVLVLGPAASGKSTLASLLSARFTAPHINVGELLYEEVKQATPLGLEAKVFMDGSKTVPDRFFIQLLAERLAQPDCIAQGWVVDGFPHTAAQVEQLAGLGLVPDKVLMLNGEHALLMDRSKWRRIDYVTNKVYLIPGPGALSPPTQPLDSSGAVDQAVMGRLTVRHDDSPENVQARLKLYDEALPQLRTSFSAVTLRLDASLPAEQLFKQAEGFITVEAERTDIQVVESWRVREAQVAVVDVMRHCRRQVVQLQQSDGARCWVDLQELASNTHCIILHQDPSLFKHQSQLRRVDLSTVHRTHLMLLDSPEPPQLLCTLSQGPQHPLAEQQQPNRRVLLMAGPEGVGRSTIVSMLLKDFPDKFQRVALSTTRPPFKLERSGSAGFAFTSQHELEKQQKAGRLLCSYSQEGHSYALPGAALESLWGEGRMAVLEGGPETVRALREVEPKLALLVIALECDLEALDQRMRLADKLHEQEVQGQLDRAAQVLDELKAGPSGADHVVRNDTLMDCYSEVRHLVSRSWPQPRVHCPTMLLLEAFEWTEPKPGPSILRLHTRMGGASMVNLPRGRHLLRIHSSSEQLHAAGFLSTTPFTLAELSKVLPEHYGLSVVTQEGEHPAQPAGSWRILFRYNFHITEPDCKLLCSVSISNQEVRKCSRVLLVNNDDLSESLQLLSAAAPEHLQPNAKGYTLMALAEAWQDLEPGPWHLSIASSAPLRDFAPSPVTRTVALEGTYATSVRANLYRYILTLAAPAQLGLCATTSPLLPTKLSILEVPPTGALDWSRQYLPVFQRGADAKLAVSNLSLPAGRFLLQVQLDTSRLPVDFLPATGELPGTPVAWQLVLLPSTDEKAFVVAKDESQATAFKGMVEGWGAALVVVPPGKAALGKDRPKAAQVAMDRTTAEATSGASRAAEVVRPLANKTTMTLEPAKHLRQLQAEARSSHVLTPDVAAAEATRQQEVVKEEAQRFAATAAERSGLRKGNEGLLQSKGTDFAQWRETQAAKKSEASEKLRALLKAPNKESPAVP